MEIFIKDRRTFTTKAHCFVLNYQIERSIYDTVSPVTIVTPEELPNEGDIAYIDGLGFFGVISTITPDHDMTELGLTQINTLFSREMFYNAQAFTYLEDRLAQLITDNFINCPDPFYAMPYLSVNALTHTTSQMQPDIENNVFSVKSYAAKMRRLYNIYLDWTISRTELTVNIAKRVQLIKNVDFSNPSYILTTEEFSSKRITKITSFCEEDNAMQDWTLLDDGSIVTGAPASGRITGEWSTLTVAKAADVADAVKDVFLKNEYSHKIEFWAPKASAFGLYDSLKIKLGSKVFSSYVSGVVENKNSETITVKCGELQTTFPYLNRE